MAVYHLFRHLKNNIFFVGSLVTASRAVEAAAPVTAAPVTAASAKA